MNPCQIEACNGKPVCAECRKLSYCPGASHTTSSPSDLTEALLQIKAALPKATRMHATGSIVVLTLGAHIPSKSDAASATGFIRAMVATGKRPARTTN